MCALNDLVRSGKVRYLGASSMYAWEFAQLQYTARSRGWAEFVSMQPFYNLLYREEEREMIPFCRATGVAVIPWSPIARGLLARPLGKQQHDTTPAATTSDAAAAIMGGGGAEDGQGQGQGQGLSLRSKTDTKTQAWFADANMEIVRRVEEVANKKGVSMALVSTAWVLHKGCWPIIGLSSENRVKQIVEVFKVKLTDEEVAYLESEYKPRAIHGM
jgi:aryl-alcohol dehydrogenase-like predicted oxidoreductase